MDVIIMQTSDSIFYHSMLQETSKTVRKYCELNGIKYAQYIGIKNGNMPWKSTYNRIYMLKELLDSGFRGWALYLDADCYISDINFDLINYLSERKEYGGIFAGYLEGVPYGINAGGFAINYDSPIGRSIVSDYYDNFKGIENKNLDYAMNWGVDVEEDQGLLHQTLKKYVNDHLLEDKIIFEHVGNSYVNTGPFINQALRSVHNSFNERLLAIFSEIRKIFGADIEPMQAPDPGLFYFYASHPKLSTDVGSKNDVGIYTDGKNSGCLMYGPYISLSCGKYIAKITGRLISFGSQKNADILMDISHNEAKELISKNIYAVSNIGYFTLELPFEIENPVEDLEVRIFTPEELSMRISSVKIELTH